MRSALPFFINCCKVSCTIFVRETQNTKQGFSGSIGRNKHCIFLRRTSSIADWNIIRKMYLISISVNNMYLLSISYKLLRCNNICINAFRYLWLYKSFKIQIFQVSVTTDIVYKTILYLTKPITIPGSMAEWLTRRISNPRIVSSKGSNPISVKPLFPWERNFTLIAQYWLVPREDSRVLL